MPPWISWVADGLSILAAVFALAGWIQSRKVKQYLESEQQRLSQTVRILLRWDNGQNILELPGKLRREDLSRAEILGFLGMIPMKVKGGRFDLQYLSTSDFYDQMNKISMEIGDSTLIIDTTATEMEQFNRERFSNQTNPGDGIQIFTFGTGALNDPPQLLTPPAS